MVEFGTSIAFRGWVRVRVLGSGFGVRGRKVKSRDCALASDLVRALSLSLAVLLLGTNSVDDAVVAVIPDPRAARSLQLRFSPS